MCCNISDASASATPDAETVTDGATKNASDDEFVDAVNDDVTQENVKQLNDLVQVDKFMFDSSITDCDAPNTSALSNGSATADESLDDTIASAGDDDVKHGVTNDAVNNNTDNAKPDVKPSPVTSSNDMNSVSSSDVSNKNVMTAKTCEANEENDCHSEVNNCNNNSASTDQVHENGDTAESIADTSA